MKKTLLCLMVLIVYIPSIFAQTSKIEKSVPFDEPEYGWNKLLQLKNGNTFFFHSTKKDGIEVSVYDKQRKLIATKTLESKLWDVSKMRKSTILGLYEINNEPVLFVVQGEGRVPTLYRMRINPNTAAIVKEDEIGSLPKIGMFAGYAILFGGADIPNIVVEKILLPDCYAAIFFDGLTHDRSKRIKIIHFDGNHKVLNTVYYDAPDQKYESLRYIGATVDGSKRVFIAAYGFTGDADRDASPKVFVSKINAGEKKFTHLTLNVSNDFNDTKSVMLYNHNNNKIQLLTLTTDLSKVPVFAATDFDYYIKKNLSSVTLLSYIDPETLKLISVQPLEGIKIDAYGKQNIDKDYEFDGVPLNMVINKDNTTTILMEKVENVTSRSGTENKPMNKRQGMAHTSIKTRLGPIGISELSDTGAEIKGYAISKLQQADGTLPVLYMAERSKGRFTYPATITHKYNNNQFLSYDYINAGKNRYVIFNDLPRNADKDEDEEKRKIVTSVSSTNAMCYRLNDPKMDKFYLFGEPDGKHVSSYCYIESSDYNQDLGTYATMVVSHDGKDDEVYIAWLTFE